MHGMHALSSTSYATRWPLSCRQSSAIAPASATDGRTSMRVSVAWSICGEHVAPSREHQSHVVHHSRLEEHHPTLERRDHLWRVRIREDTQLAAITLAAIVVQIEERRELECLPMRAEPPASVGVHRVAAPVARIDLQPHVLRPQLAQPRHGAHRVQQRRVVLDGRKCRRVAPHISKVEVRLVHVRMCRAALAAADVAIITHRVPQLIVRLEGLQLGAQGTAQRAWQRAVHHHIATIHKLLDR
eukprot:5278646-Prymnesium_polylepis.1